MDFKYLPPRLTEHCICKDKLVRTAMCEMGHINDCHYPLDCSMAACFRLAGQGFEAEEIDTLQTTMRGVFVQLADSDCPTCEGAAFREINTTSKELYATEDGRIENEDLQFETPCDCVRSRLDRVMKAKQQRAPNPEGEHGARNAHR